MTGDAGLTAVTSVTVARICNVSQSTVSRALRGDPRISAATRKRIAEAAESVGYIASDLGRSLSTRRTQQIAMITDLNNPLYPEMVPIIHDTLAERGYRMLIEAESGDEASLYQPLLNGSVDGAVLTTTRLGSSLAHELQRRRFPFVFLNRVSDSVEADSVEADNVGGASQAARLLVTLGHRRIGALFGPTETSTGRSREAAFRSVLADSGIALPERAVYRGWFSYSHGLLGFAKIMGEQRPPTAVFCVSDGVAIGFLNAAQQAGLRIPGDVAVIGFDDIPISAWPVFNLTTIHVPLQEMARSAVTKLIDRLTGTRTGPFEHEVQPTTLVLRSTHGDKVG